MPHASVSCPDSLSKSVLAPVSIIVLSVHAPLPGSVQLGAVVSPVNIGPVRTERTIPGRKWNEESEHET